MNYQHDPGGQRLPVKLDTTTNGEFAPVPLAPVHRQARQIAHEAVDANAKRLGLGRRDFLVSACGVTTSLLGMNAAYARAGASGGYFDLPAESGVDMQLARSAV